MGVQKRLLKKISSRVWQPVQLWGSQQHLAAHNLGQVALVPLAVSVRLVLARRMGLLLLAASVRSLLRVVHGLLPAQRQVAHSWMTG